MRNVSSKTLGGFSLFNGLNADELGIMAKIVKTRDVEPGTVIIREGDAGGELFLLDDGTVTIHKTLTLVTSKHEFGTRQRSFIRLTGDDHCFFGEQALLGNNQRSATVEAVRSCRLLVIDGADFLALCEERPRIGYLVLRNIAAILSENLRRTSDDVIKLTTALSMALSG